MAYNVLIVDDSETIRAVLRKNLRMSGLEIGSILDACNGKVALEALENNWIDIVFADINMPVMGGRELVQEMAKRDVLSHIPVIIISAEASSARIEELVNKGVKAFVKKPITPELFRSTVERVLGESGK